MYRLYCYLLLFLCPLSRAFLFWHFSSRTKSVHLHSGFNKQPSGHSVHWMTFQVYLSFVVKLSNIFTVWPPIFKLIIIITVVTKCIRWNIVDKKYLVLDNSLISITEWRGIMDIKAWKEKIDVNFFNSWDLDRPFYQYIHLTFFTKKGG